MKKLLKVLLIVSMLLCVVACSKSQENEIASLYEKGYEAITYTSYDGKWKAIFEKDYDYNDAYLVTADIDEATSNKIFEIDVFEEKGKEEFKKTIVTLANCTVKSLKDEIPSIDEFNSYIGKTIGDVENDGYDRNGSLYTEEGCKFYFDGSKYSLVATVTEVITNETIDDYSENAIRSLIIKEVQFEGFSSRILD